MEIEQMIKSLHMPHVNLIGKSISIFEKDLSLSL